MCPKKKTSPSQLINFKDTPTGTRGKKAGLVKESAAEEGEGHDAEGEKQVEDEDHKEPGVLQEAELRGAKWTMVPSMRVQQHPSRGTAKKS